MRYIEKSCWQGCDHTADREVEAFRFQLDSYMPDWFNDMRSEGKIITYIDGSLLIKVKNEWLFASKGDFVVKGEKSGVYAIKPDIFLAIYERESKEMTQGFMLDKDLINEACDMLQSKQDKAKAAGDNPGEVFYSAIKQTLRTMSDEYCRMKEEYDSLCEGIRQNAIIFTEEERKIIQLIRQQYKRKDEVK